MGRKSRVKGWVMWGRWPSRVGGAGRCEGGDPEGRKGLGGVRKAV
jgi:hypothetical protein